MLYRSLGHTGLKVSELCFGTMTFGGAADMWKAIGTLDQKVGLMAWSPLASGALTGKFSREGKGPSDARRSGFEIGPMDWDRIIDAAKIIGAEHGASIAQVALAWLLVQPVVTTVIIGARKIDQLEDNLGAVKLKLTVDQVAKLNEASKLPDEYPGWFMRDLDAM